MRVDRQRRENPSKIIRWEDNTTRSFYGSREEAARAARQDDRSKRGMRFVII